MKKIKRDILFKLTAFILINSFLCLDISWAANSNLKNLSTHLSPPLEISKSSLTEPFEQNTLGISTQSVNKYPIEIKREELTQVLRLTFSQFNIWRRNEAPKLLSLDAIILINALIAAWDDPTIIDPDDLLYRGGVVLDNPRSNLIRLLGIVGNKSETAKTKVVEFLKKIILEDPNDKVKERALSVLRHPLGEEGIAMDLEMMLTSINVPEISPTFPIHFLSPIEGHEVRTHYQVLKPDQLRWRSNVEIAEELRRREQELLVMTEQGVRNQGLFTGSLNIKLRSLCHFLTSRQKKDSFMWLIGTAKIIPYLLEQLPAEGRRVYLARDGAIYYESEYYLSLLTKGAPPDNSFVFYLDRKMLGYIGDDHPTPEKRKRDNFKIIEDTLRKVRRNTTEQGDPENFYPQLRQSFEETLKTNTVFAEQAKQTYEQLIDEGIIDNNTSQVCFIDSALNGTLVFYLKCVTEHYSSGRITANVFLAEAAYPSDTPHFVPEQTGLKDEDVEKFYTSQGIRNPLLLPLKGVNQLHNWTHMRKIASQRMAENENILGHPIARSGLDDQKIILTTAEDYLEAYFRALLVVNGAIEYLKRKGDDSNVSPHNSDIFPQDLTLRQFNPYALLGTIGAILLAFVELLKTFSHRFETISIPIMTLFQSPIHLLIAYTIFLVGVLIIGAFWRKDYIEQQRQSLMLKKIAEMCRNDILEMINIAGSGHPGGSLSAAEILVTLYLGRYSDGTRIMNHTPNDPRWPDRDRLVISEGHIAPAVYSILAKLGYISKEQLSHLRELNSGLPGHTDWICTRGIEALTGSLGMGLSNAAGMALLAKMHGRDSNVFAIAGDGEEQEGQYAEAARHIAELGLDNLTLFVNANGAQIDSLTKEVDSADVAGSWRGCGWHVIEINGHEPLEIIAACEEARNIKNKPTAIIAKTKKGKGVDFMEDDPTAFHGRALNDKELSEAIPQIENTIENISQQMNFYGFSTDVDRFISDNQMTEQEENNLSKESTLQKTDTTTIPDRTNYAQDEEVSPSVAFKNRLLQWAEKDERIVFIFNNSDSKQRFIDEFIAQITDEDIRNKLIERCFLVEDREQHLASFAAGFGYSGMLPIVFLPENDAMKMLDQLRINAQARVPFILAAESEELSFTPGVMDLMHNVIALEPGDPNETNELTDMAIKNALLLAKITNKAPTSLNIPDEYTASYIRLSSADLPVIDRGENPQPEQGAYVISQSEGWDTAKKRVILISSGKSLHQTIKVSNELESQGTMTKIINVTQLDSLGAGSELLEYIEPGSRILTIYDGLPVCLGDAVSRTVTSSSKTAGSVVWSMSDKDIENIIEVAKELVDGKEKPTDGLMKIDFSPQEIFPAGMRLSLAAGIAFGAKMDTASGRVIALATEKEEREGQFAETARFAAHNGIDNLCLVLQASETNTELVNIWQAYGWRVIELNANNNQEQAEILGQTFEQLNKDNTGKPVLIITRGFDEHIMATTIMEALNGMVPYKIGEFNLLIYSNIKQTQEPEPVQMTMLQTPAEIRYQANRNFATRDGFGNRMLDWGKRVEKIIAFCADIASSTRLNWFARDFGIFSRHNTNGRYVPSGVREQAMAGIAAGLALYGKIPVIATFDCFANRMISQIIVIARAKLPVIVALSHAGLGVGPDGSTHQSVIVAGVIRYISFLQKMTGFIPADAREAEEAVDFAMHRALDGKGPSYLQLTRQNVPVLNRGENPSPEQGAYVIKDPRENGQNSDIIIIAAGAMVEFAIAASEQLESQDITAKVINLTRLDLIDEALPPLLERGVPIITVQDASPKILSGAVSKVVTSSLLTTGSTVTSLGIQGWGQSARSHEILYRAHKMDTAAIIEAAIKIVEQQRLDPHDNNPGQLTTMPKQPPALTELEWNEMLAVEQAI
ncbi:MAG: transketolase C-terminal domain-containing protein [Candidatus Omnitrophota bacterium]